VIESAHPVPDERSLAAADAVCDLIASATAEDVVIALISGGASALIERPIAGLSIEQFVREIQALVASGADIRALNAARTARSQLKGGKLAELSAAPVRTLVASDVIDDDVRVVGSGPTCTRRIGDTCTLAIPIRSFVQAVELELRRLVTYVTPLVEPLVAPVAACADALLADLDPDATRLAWGEPVIALPVQPGEGGRAQQLALELARRLRGTDRFAFVAGSDGQDGPKPFGRPAPAGAFVDGATWDRITQHLDPAAALARCDAGTALDSVGALVITQATGINHGDIAIVGRAAQPG
jgi:hydroxypyruvate reductase